MGDLEFDSLVNGPLSHPLAAVAMHRLIDALRAVLDWTGAPGAQALRRHCRGCARSAGSRF